MRTAMAIAVALLSPAALAAVAPPASAGPVDRAASAYETYVACSTKKSAPASHSCGKNQPKAAFFKSKSEHVTFKICVKYPGRSSRLCASDQDAPKGTKQVNTITSSTVGKHKVKWYVDGKKVGAFTFRVTAG